MKQQKIKVHIADDHKILIEGIIALLNTDNDIEIEGYSLTGKEVVDWAKQNQADVLILDINMPELDGIEVMKFFKARNIKQKTIILSSLSDIKIVQEMVSLGINGFLEKSCAGEHIIKAIKTVIGGGQYFSNDIQVNLIQALTKPQEEKEEGSELSKREIDVLKMIAREYNTPQIAEKLNISESTVITYRKNLHSKLKIKNAVGLAIYAVKNNII